jgi:hypothetical protein
LDFFDGFLGLFKTFNESTPETDMDTTGFYASSGRSQLLLIDVRLPWTISE